MAIQQPLTEEQEKEQQSRKNIQWFASMLDKNELEVLEALAQELSKKYSKRYQDWKNNN